MQPSRYRLIAILTATAVALCSCKTKLHYVVEGPLNKNPSGQATDLYVALFFLLDDTGLKCFEAATYDELQKEVGYLDNTAQNRKKGQRLCISKSTGDTTVYRDIAITEPDVAYAHLGIIGNFFQKDANGCKWKLAVPKGQLDDYQLVIKEHAFDWQPRPR